MTVLDTFYLLFKTDAGGSSGAKADIAALDTQITELAKKGKARDEAENKQLRELRKERQGATRDLKDQTQEVDKLGQSFVKMIEGGAQAAAAVFAFGAIKSGVLNAAQFNSALEVQGKLIGQNTGQLQAYAAAAQAAGGTQAGFLGQVQGIFQNLAASGISTPAVGALFDRLRAGAKQFNTPAGKELYFQRLGISDTGFKTIISQSDEDYAKGIAHGREDARVTEEDTKAAREFEKAWSETTQSISSAFTKLGSDIFPVIIPALKSFSSLMKEASEHTGGIEAILTAMAATSLLVATGLTKIATALIGIGSGGALSGISVLGKAFGIVGLFGGAAEIGYGIGDAITGKRESLLGRGAGVVSEKILDLWYGKPKRSDSRSLDNNKRESFNFWTSQGYTPEQAAGLVANEQLESGFDPTAIGDGGKATGSFQWHLKRVERILKATGIDVSSASHADQLRAAAWELQDSGVAAKLKRAGSAQEAGALISSQFERPADSARQAIIRGSLAARIAQEHLDISAASQLNSTGSVISNTSSADKSLSIKTGDINVHTQATDAHGISMGIGSALSSEFRNAFSNFDDGVAG